MSFWNLVRGALYPGNSIILNPTQSGNVDGSDGDTTRRIEIATYQQANGGAPYGDLLRLISLGGRAKGGVKWYGEGSTAIIVPTLPSTTTGTFNITAGTDIIISVDGVSYDIEFTSTTVLTVAINGGTARTLTRSGGWFAALATTTQAELARALTAALNPLDADTISGVTLSSTVGMQDSQAQCFKDTLNFDEFDGLIIASPIQGVVSSIKATGGTAGAALGLTNEASPVASGALLTLPVSSNRVFPITGSTTLNMIVNTSWTAGDVIALKFGSAITVAHNTGSSTSTNNRIYLKDKTSWAASAGDVIYLTNNTDADGGNNYWYEVGRTVGTNARFQWAWILAHFMPNNVSSENQHQHISFEVADRKGDMQTRLGIIYGSNKTLVTVTSADFAVNGGRILVDPTSGIVGTSDITPQNKVRRWRMRTNSTTNNLDFQVYDDTGATSTTLMSLDRASQAVVLSAMIQEKQHTTASTVAAGGGYLLTPTPINGNQIFVNTSADMRLIANTNCQAGTRIVVRFIGSATINHNQTSSPAPTATNRPIWLAGSANKTIGANGAMATFRYSGTSFSDRWELESLIEY
jgi:hypothetical protein